MRTQTTLSDGWVVRQSSAEDLSRLLGVGSDHETLEKELSADGWIPATVPQEVHELLLSTGRIEDPRVGRNAARCVWVGESDWLYACRFGSPPPTGGPVFLRFDGLDTLVDVYLNGQPIGSFANMFRTYEVDVTSVLAPQGEENLLLLYFHSALEFIDRQPDLQGIGKHKYIRKTQSDFTSYMGAAPHWINVGVYRDVLLDVPDQAWIDDVTVRTRLSHDHRRAMVTVLLAIRGTGPIQAECSVRDSRGTVVATGSALDDRVELEIENPALWWPWTHGDPHLYELDVTLRADGRVVDTRSLRFGIREVQLILEEPETGQPAFRFMVNGRDIFLRGINWAPVEGITHVWQPERAGALLDMVQDANANALRVWGGGLVPDDEFYDECDRRGILVWQDFMFGFGMVPDHLPDYLENCSAEVAGVVRRLRNHPSLFLWVGGNENHMGWDFTIGGTPERGRRLFEEVMPEVCRELDPTRPFHPSSPFGNGVPNWPLSGDWHDYTTLTFSPGASVPLFASETGRTSAPDIESMRRFLSPDELWPADHDPAIRKPGQPAWPPMWQYRSVSGSWDKIGALEQYCDPTGPEDLVRILGTAHGEYLQRRIERHRRGRPDGAPLSTVPAARRCWGTMPWRLNDSWPIIYWSVVDYYLKPKIPYYFLRRAYRPILLCFEQTDDVIRLWVVNDSPDHMTGVLSAKRVTFDGELRGELTADVSVAPGTSQCCLDLTDFGPISLRTELLFATLHGSPEVDEAAVHLLSGERYLHLPTAQLRLRRVGEGISVASDSFARQVVLSAQETDEAPKPLFDDNYFDLAPGQERVVSLGGEAERGTVRAAGLNAAAVEEQI